MDVDTLEKPSTTDLDDEQRFSHLADKNDITRAHVEGIPIRALCGKKWIPSRDPSKYPICQQCKEMFEIIFGKPFGGSQ